MKRTIEILMAALLIAALCAGCAGARTAAPATAEAPTAAPTEAPTPTPEPTATPEPTPEPTPYGQFVWKGFTGHVAGYSDDQNYEFASAFFSGPAGKYLLVVYEFASEDGAYINRPATSKDDGFKLVGPDGTVYATGVSKYDNTRDFHEYDIPADADPADFSVRIPQEDGTELLVPLSGIPVWEQPAE